MKEKIRKLKASLANPKYPPPQSGEVFVKFWNALINQVVNHNRFNEIQHLSALETLCSLHQEERQLMDFLNVHGYTYEVPNSRTGQIFKPRPEKTLLYNCRVQIRSYTKSLGLDLDLKSGSRGKTKESVIKADSKTDQGADWT